MTNPEIGHPGEFRSERQQAEHAVAEFSAALDTVAASMRDLAHNTVFSGVDEFVPVEMLERLDRSADPVRGYPIQGQLMNNQYLVTIDGVAERGRLPHRRHGFHDFEGVFSGIGRVTMTEFGSDKTFEQLCLIVNPLYLLGDIELSNNYAQKGWIDQLRHPFASKEHQDKPIYLPVNMISERGIRLVDRWKIS